MRAKGVTTVLLASALVAAAGMAVLTAGCAKSPATNGPLPTPGLTKHSDGTATAYGYVERISYEGGFWAVLSEPASATGKRAVVYVILIPGKVTASGLSAVAGHFVEASGTLAQGVSTRAAGPEMRVDSVRSLAGGTP